MACNIWGMGFLDLKFLVFLKINTVSVSIATIEEAVNC